MNLSWAEEEEKENRCKEKPYFFPIKPTPDWKGPPQAGCEAMERVGPRGTLESGFANKSWSEKKIKKLMYHFEVMV